VGIISLLSEQLLRLDFEECVQLLAQKTSHDIDIEKLFQIIGNLKISSKRWKSLVKYDMRSVTLLSLSQKEKEKEKEKEK